jgi:hypothetical protein
MPMRNPRSAASIALVASVLLGACGGPADTPADRVEAPSQLEEGEVTTRGGTLEPSLDEKGAESERLGGAGHEDR